MLKKDDVRVLKSLSNPPQPVKELLTVTLLLLGYPEKEAENWKVCQRVLAGTGKDGLLQQMENMDASSIPPDTVTKARAKLQECSKERVLSVAAAACGLYEWATRMIA